MGARWSIPTESGRRIVSLSRPAVGAVVLQILLGLRAAALLPRGRRLRRADGQGGHTEQQTKDGVREFLPGPLLSSEMTA